MVIADLAITRVPAEVRRYYNPSSTITTWHLACSRTGQRDGGRHTAAAAARLQSSYAKFTTPVTVWLLAWSLVITAGPHDIVERCSDDDNTALEARLLMS